MSLPGGSAVKNPLANAGDMDLIPGSGRSPEEEMTTNSILLTGKIAWTEWPRRLQSIGSRRSDRTEHRCTQPVIFTNGKAETNYPFLG